MKVLYYINRKIFIYFLSAEPRTCAEMRHSFFFIYLAALTQQHQKMSHLEPNQPAHALRVASLP